MNVFIFGATCSPSYAPFALRKTAEDNLTGASNHAVHTVFKNFYVDDLLKSCRSVEEASALVSELFPLLESGGFHVTKFLSNEPGVLSFVPEDDQASAILDLNLDDLATTKALGVYWNMNSNCFEVRVSIQKRPLTKRGLRSMVSQIYDVLGLVQTFILPARKLLQEISREQNGWDDPLDESQCNAWKSWIQGLDSLNRVSVARCFKLPYKEMQCIELYVFFDGSTIGYGVACYVRTVYVDGHIDCGFAAGKSRVSSPNLTIPRLELTAATVAAKLCALISTELKYEFERIILWTDATTVLHYIRNDTFRFHTFVANRLRLIHSLSSPEQWRYVPSQLNPADIASRGLMTDKIDNATLWFDGPQFLRESEINWPRQPDLRQPLTTDDPEVKKKTTTICAAVESSPVNYLHGLLLRCSAYKAIQRCAAWLLRFKQYWRWKYSNNKMPPRKGPLTADDLKDATLAIVQLM